MRYPLTCGLLVMLLTVEAPDLAGQGTRLLREPTASTTEIAFAHAGDIWIVPKDGGEARRLTSFPGIESDPHFSPDGKLVAFTGEYGGNADVFVIPAVGGEPRRLTWHPVADRVRGWSPDGRQVLFASGRASAPYQWSRLWTVPLEGGLPTQLPLPQARAGTYSPDGRRIVYERSDRWDEEFRNYRGGQNGPLRILTLSDLSEVKLPWDGARNDSPVWLGDTIYFLSDRDYGMNLYSWAPGQTEARQLTHFRDFDAKHLGGGGGILVFEQAGYIHRYDPATGTERQLSISVRGDLPWALPHWVDVGASITNAGLSPSGTRAVFEARGEIFTVPVDKGNYRNLTNSPGAADRSPVWSPDGKRIAWFSDASGEYRLMIGEQDGLSPPRAVAIQHPSFFYTPAWSPDSRYLAFTDEGLHLRFIDVATGAETLVDTDQFAHPERTVNPVWSPDSKWIAYVKRLDSQLHVIRIYSLKDAKSYQVTDGLSDAVAPAWDAGGRYLYFLASTNFALSSGWLDMSSYEHEVDRGVYLVVLRADDPSPLLPESDEEKGRKDSTAADSTARAGKAAKGGKGKGKPEAESARPDSTAVRIDFANLASRILALDVPIRNYVALVSGAAGSVYFAEQVRNQTGLTLSRFDLKKREATTLLSGVDQFVLSQDGKKLLYQAGQQWGVVDGDKPFKAGDGKLKTALRMRLDPPAEWAQIFREAWRIERDYFYVKNLHGANWDSVYAMYAPWVAGVEHRSDLTHLLDILGGELSVGHSFTGGGDTPPLDTVRVGLLGADLSVENGRYRLARIYSGENWNPGLEAPLSAPGIRVNRGDYLLAVNGVDLRPPTEPYSLFEGTVGRQTVLLVNDRPSTDGARSITVVPVASEASLRARVWVEDNRRAVDSLSGGRLAYVWVPNTADAGYASFNRYYFAQQGKAGAVIDERFNQGGSIADYMIDVMARKLRGFFNNPVGDHKPFMTPQAGIYGPKVLLINELAGSGGDMLPYMFRQMKLGPLVGTRTWGGLVGIWDAPPLVDGGYITAPRGGFYDLDGKWAVENEGIAPDIEVEQTPKEVGAGHDPQLERGVQEALRLLATESVKILPEPAPPVKVRRP